MAGWYDRRRPAPLWIVLRARQLYDIGTFSIYFSYPLMPWIGVMLLGYACAQVNPEHAVHHFHGLVLEAYEQASRA